MKGLHGCHAHDLVILSDVDEIVRGTKIPRMVELINSGQAQAIVCEQNMYQGFLNRYQSKWHGTVCTPYRVIKRISTKSTRRLRNMRERLMRRTGITKITCLPDAGWHFTSMGGIDRHILKLESYSHAEFDRPELKQAEKILQSFRSHQFVELDQTFPQFIVDHRARFEEMGFIDTVGTSLTAAAGA
jgi:beta-1,4-mannosyl-glycoprotein beta-1,4-N-acetylglucosaminyltransferase